MIPGPRRFVDALLGGGARAAEGNVKRQAGVARWLEPPRLYVLLLALGVVLLLGGR